MTNDPEKLSPMEEGLLRAMKSLDSQIQRNISTRTPLEREEQGMDKWQAYQDRVERVCSFILNALGEDTVTLDSLIILSQAFPKTLQILVEDLEPDELGKVRREYCVAAFSSVSDSAMRGKNALDRQGPLN